MKKLFKTPKYRRYNLRHARRSLEAQIRFKKYKKKKNRHEQGLGKDLRKTKRKVESNFRDYLKVSAPENFSLIENPDNVIQFINKLNNAYEDRKKVFIVLKDIKKMQYDALVVLLSIMVQFKAKRIAFNGDFPKDYIARTKLEESGFFKYLYKSFKEEERYYLTKKDLIHTHAWKNVDSKLSASLIKEAANHIWENEYRCPGAQRTLIELMQNTNNHANISEEGVKHWWLSITPFKSEKKVSFSFLDFGVGVFKSLNNKTPENKFFGWADKLLKRFTIGNNVELLKLILSGDFHQTVTGKHFRGKGLPGIMETYRRKQITNLHIITNNVYANISKNDFKIIKHSFTGTFIYWELNSESLHV